MFLDDLETIEATETESQAADLYMTEEHYTFTEGE